MARRGRPVIAAQTLDEAVARVFAWHPPLRWTRPRNSLERQAQAQRRGPKPKPSARTGQAAQLAAYLVKTEGKELAAAARQAAKAWDVNADNVRKAARRLIVGASVDLPFKGPAWMPIPPIRALVLAEVRDACPEDCPPK